MDMFTVIYDAFSSVITQIIGVFPRIFGAIILLLVGWILAKIVTSVLGKFLIRIGVNKWAEKLNESPAFIESNIHLNPVSLLQKFLYWTFMLVFLMSAAETMELNIVSEQISQLIQYLPRLLTALVIMGIGFYVSGLVREAVGRAAKSFGVPAWRFLGSITFYLLITIVGVTALEQAGIDTEVITSNLSIILGGIFLAFAIAYGFAARDVLSSILTSFYSKANFHLGQVVEVEGVKGTIVKMDSVTLALDTGEKVVVFPLNRLHSDKVTIYKPGFDHMIES